MAKIFPFLLIILSLYSIAASADSFQLRRNGRIYTCTSNDGPPNDCIETVVKVHWDLFGHGCSGNKPWACYRDIVTSCTNGHEETATILSGCKASFNECR